MHGGELAGARAAVVCAPQDMWFPAHQHRDLVEALPRLEVRLFNPPQHLTIGFQYVALRASSGWLQHMFADERRMYDLCAGMYAC